MRSFAGSGRRQGAPILVDDRPYSVNVIRLAGDQDFEIVTQTDQAAIEHPMGSPGERQAIADDIRTISLHGSNMCRRNLRPAAAIDQLQSRDSTTRIVSSHHNLSENAVAYQP